MQDIFSLESRNISYWEKDVLGRRRDFVVIGAGLVGLSAAMSIKEKYPSSDILLLDRACIPYGASTRNAGFACFGSMSEIIDDLQTMSKTQVQDLISKRWNGLKLLRNRIGDKGLSYQKVGGYEMFSAEQGETYEICKNKLGEINDLIFKAIGLEDCFKKVINSFGIVSPKALIYNQYEGQIHPGKMIRYLQQLVLGMGIEIQYGVDVKSYDTIGADITICTSNEDVNINCNKLVITTNAFTPNIIEGLDIKPGRNQVMMTKPIKDLKIRGCFHYDKGYVYFRNFENRILIGGGRNVAMEEEATDSFGMTNKIKEYLRKLMKEVIIPNIEYKEDMWWSGIIATGASKMPIVKELSENVYLGVRSGGMGVALGSMIGQELAELV